MLRDASPAGVACTPPASSPAPSSPLSDDGEARAHAHAACVPHTRAGAPHAAYAELPQEILLHIFRYVLASQRDLRACMLVCRRWCACAVELLWHRPVVFRPAALFQLVHVLMQGRAFPYAAFVRRLNFSLLAGELDDGLLGRTGLCTRLQRLTLAGCTNVMPDTLVRVLSHTHALASIDLTGVVHTTDRVLDALAQNCPHLQGANLTGCPHITSSGVQALARCTQLRRVKLCGCEQVDNRAFFALLDACPHVFELDMMHCPRITDAAISRVWLQPNQLRELRLAHCTALTDRAFPTDALRAAGSGAFLVSESMRILDVTGCHHLSDDAVRGIVDYAPRLRNLALAKCTRLTDAAVYAVAELGRNLQYLHLAHLAQLTDAAVVHLVRSCTRIRYLDLACCTALSDTAVIELSANLQKLRRIGLVRLAQLTDASVYALGERHATLERIHLSYCEQLSVPAIFWLTQRLGRLTHLSLTGVPAFRRPELQSMCRAPPSEFNHHQRQAFCVYSGRGVDDLRRYLAHIFSDDTRAAQFGALHPDIRRALSATASASASAGA